MGLALVLIASATVLGLFGYQGLSVFGCAVLCGLTVPKACGAVRPETEEPFQYVQGADIFLV
jgi:hypothetical protein